MLTPASACFKKLTIWRSLNLLFVPYWVDRSPRINLAYKATKRQDMQASRVKRSLKALCAKKIPVFLWGPPGIGKSSIVAQIAHEQNIDFIDLRLSLLDPTDLRGIPFFDTTTHQAMWAPPVFLPTNEQKEGILFLDELNTAAPMVQASAYQLILDRKIGEYTLPDGWAIVAAGNRESDRGVVFRMAAPLANRFVHITMHPDIEDFKLWAQEKALDPTVLAFVISRPDALFSIPKDPESRAFATPRTWEYVHDILAATEDETLLLDLISGAVGEELAASFLAFRSVDLPNIDDILQGACDEVPQDSSALHVLCTTLSMRVDQTTSTKKLDNIVRYSLKMPKEFAVMLISDIRQRNIELDHVQSWPLWMKQCNHLLR